jgi:hypothetical protein
VLKGLATFQVSTAYNGNRAWPELLKGAPLNRLINAEFLLPFMSDNLKVECLF